MEGDVDAAETFGIDVLLQTVIHAEAFFQHLLILRETLVPRDAEGRDGSRRGDLGTGMVQHHGGTAIAAEGSRGRVHCVHFAAAVGTGEKIHLNAVAGLTRFALIGGLNAFRTVTHAAFQLLPRGVEDHHGAASRATVQEDHLLI